MLAKCVSMAPPWGKLLFILCIRSTKQLYVIASVTKKNDNNIGEKDYVILYLSGQIPRKTAQRRLR